MTTKQKMPGENFNRAVEWLARHPQLVGVAAVLFGMGWYVGSGSLAGVGLIAAGALLFVAPRFWRGHAPAVAVAGAIGPAPEIAKPFSPPRRDEGAPLPPPVTQLSALPVGLVLPARRDPWLLQLLGTHNLVSGVTGAGKSWMLWAIIEALCPWIRHGSAEVWVCDPKGGQALGLGRRLFFHTNEKGVVIRRYVSGRSNIKQMADMLEEAVAESDRRARAHENDGLDVIPSVREPLIVVVVDELAWCCAYSRDAAAKKRINAALEELSSQGRSTAITVLGCLQDPRKSNVDFRDLIPDAIGMRMQTRTQVKMVMGDGAWEDGAKCDRIPKTMPGAAFVKMESSDVSQAEVQLSYTFVRCHAVGLDQRHRLAETYGRDAEREAA